MGQRGKERQEGRKDRIWTGVKKREKEEEGRWERRKEEGRRPDKESE